jgi:hypothetical protein
MAGVHFYHGDQMHTMWLWQQQGALHIQVGHLLQSSCGVIVLVGSRLSPLQRPPMFKLEVYQKHIYGVSHWQALECSAK